MREAEPVVSALALVPQWMRANEVPCIVTLLVPPTWIDDWSTQA
jgi:hypothetical protein